MQFIIQSGKIDINDVQNSMEAMKRKELLEKHPYKIWQGEDGKWYTYLPDDKKGRVQRESETVRKELKKISSATHLRNRQIFNRHYSEFGRKRIKLVTDEDFSDFLERQISQHNLTSKAFSNLKTITRGFLKSAKKRKMISFSVEDLFQELDTSDTDFKKIIKEDYEEVFDEEETYKMIEYLKDNPDMMIWEYCSCL